MAVRNHGAALEHLPLRFKADRSLVIEAVQQMGYGVVLLCSCQPVASNVVVVVVVAAQNQIQPFHCGTGSAWSLQAKSFATMMSWYTLRSGNMGVLFASRRNGSGRIDAL